MTLGAAIRTGNDMDALQQAIASAEACGLRNNGDTERARRMVETYQVMYYFVIL